MARGKEFTTKTRKEALKRSNVVCAQCGCSFDRGYAISARRAARPQLCSVKCRAALRAERARDRLAQRFWAKVAIGGDEDCWPWTGRLNENGYGVFDLDSTPNIASRIAYMLANGVDPSEAMVCHSCDNPPCCNPSHLWLGSHGDNMKDMALKGRAHVIGWCGDDHPRSKLSSVDVLTIRASGTPTSILAREFGVTTSAIYNIRERKTWRHL